MYETLRILRHLQSHLFYHACFRLDRFTALRYSDSTLKSNRRNHSGCVLYEVDDEDVHL